jgi:hypothetical protein
MRPILKRLERLQRLERLEPVGLIGTGVEIKFFMGNLASVRKVTRN